MMGGRAENGEISNSIRYKTMLAFTLFAPMVGAIGYSLRDCLKIGSGAAAGDFDFGRGGAGGGASRTGQSPQRAVTPATTKPKIKRPAARRVFMARAGWRRCSSVEDP